MPIKILPKEAISVNNTAQLFSHLASLLSLQSLREEF